MLLLSGLVSVSVPDPLHAGCGDGPQSPIRRCSISKACVLEPGRIRTAELMGNELVYVTGNGALYPIGAVGKPVIAGRLVIGLSFESNRYGGV